MAVEQAARSAGKVEFSVAAGEKRRRRRLLDGKQAGSWKQQLTNCPNRISQPFFGALACACCIQSSNTRRAKHLIGPRRTLAPPSRFRPCVIVLAFQLLSPSKSTPNHPQNVQKRPFRLALGTAARMPNTKTHCIVKLALHRSRWPLQLATEGCRCSCSVEEREKGPVARFVVPSTQRPCIWAARIRRLFRHGLFPIG